MLKSASKYDAVVFAALSKGRCENPYTTNFTKKAKFHFLRKF